MRRRRALILVALGLLLILAALSGLRALRFAGILIPPALLAIAALAVDRILGWVRPRIDARRRRPKRGIFFKAFFLAYSLALVVWLVAGLAPAIARRSPTLHDRLHESGGATTKLELEAREFSFSVPVLSVPAGGLATIRFTNRDKGIQHNVAVLLIDQGRMDPEEGDRSVYSPVEVPLYSSRSYTGPALREISFVAPEPGTYSFRCEVVDEIVGDHAVYMTGALNVGPNPNGVRAPSGTFIDIARGTANASHYAKPLGEVVLDYLFSVLTLGLGMFLVARRPLDRVARFFGVGMIGTAAAYNIQSHAAIDVVPAIADFIHPLFVHPISGLAYVYALVLFPDGKLVPRIPGRTLRVLYGVGLFYALAILLVVGDLFEPSPGPGHAVAFVQSFGLLIPLVGFIAQTYRLRTATTSEKRQQSKLLLWALTPAMVFGTLIVVARILSETRFSGPEVVEFESLVFRLFQPVFIVIPIAIIVGILRYRLWDIDIVINRAILYGALAAFIGAVYVAIVVGIGRAIGGTSRTGLSIGATVVVAVAFESVRRRVQRIANRLVYGARATPYEVMAGFSRSVTGALHNEDVMPRMAEAATRGIGGVRGRVQLFLPGGEMSVNWPESAAGEDFDLTIDVVHQGQSVGRIAVAKAPGDAPTQADHTVIVALAAQAGVALHSLRLIEELRGRVDEISARAKDLAESRYRIMSAQDAESRRLEREISDEVEPRLLAMEDALAKTSRLLSRSPSKAQERLDAIGSHTHEALEALRDLARGIFPPLLADKGVVPALEAQIRKFGLPARVRATKALASRRFDPSAEATVYFCCSEALKFAARAGAGLANISIGLVARDGVIEFTIGGTRAHQSPAEIQDMTDRVEAVGGTLEISDSPRRGTVITGRVPLEPPGQARAGGSRPQPVAAAHASVRRSGPNDDFGM